MACRPSHRLTVFFCLVFLPGCPDGDTGCYRHEDRGPCRICQSGSCIPWGDGCCAWVIEVVDHLGDVGLNVSLKLDEGGSPHFSYQEGGSSAEVRYACR